MGKQSKKRANIKIVAVNNTLSTSQQLTRLQLADTLLRLLISVINLISKLAG